MAIRTGRQVRISTAGSHEISTGVDRIFIDNPTGDGSQVDILLPSARSAIKPIYIGYMGATYCQLIAQSGELIHISDGSVKQGRYVSLNHNGTNAYVMPFNFGDGVFGWSAIIAGGPHTTSASPIV